MLLVVQIVFKKRLFIDPNLTLDGVKSIVIIMLVLLWALIIVFVHFLVWYIDDHNVESECEEISMARPSFISQIKDHPKIMSTSITYY